MNSVQRSRVLPPRVEGAKCIWQAPIEFSENEALAGLGHLQQALASPEVTSCEIALSLIEWADPVPLLCLTLILAESKLDRSAITIDLGSVDKLSSTADHRVFLKFFANQNFLVALGEHAMLKCNGKIEEDSHALRLRLVDEPQSGMFINADWISAQILPMHTLGGNSAQLQIRVEELLREAQDRSLGSAFGSEPRARDMLFQKLRKLLFELLSNVAEHSHEHGQKCYAGVFARIRGAKPPNAANAEGWIRQFERGKRVHGQSAITLNPFSEWMELFICDVGMGLTARIAEWRVSGDPDADRDLSRAQRAANPLHSIAFRLFRNALSRHARHDVDRTAVTGLQHLGHLLAIGDDYCRIYSQRGTWIGGHVPWGVNHSHMEIKDGSRVRGSEIEAKPVSGTCFAISIQPTHSEMPNRQEWKVASDQQLAEVRQLLRTQKAFHQRPSIKFFDRRIAATCSPADMEPDSNEPLAAFVLRPPRLISKIDASRWLGVVAGFRHVPASRKIGALFIVDLTPFQGAAFRDIFISAEAHADSGVDIYLVTETWDVACLSTSPGKLKFVAAPEKAEKFVQPMNGSGTLCMGELAVLLRQMDSEIFWDAAHKETDPYFFEGPVEWPTGDEGSEIILLPRYLDFPRALTDPRRYRACRRALRRCLALFRDHQSIPADDLVKTLLQDAQSGSYGVTGRSEDAVVVVGSVAVTTGTANLAKPREDAEILHVIVHGDAPADASNPLLSAILWISDLGESEDTAKSLRLPDAKGKPWRRVPGTPYIAPLGERSISVVRYKRRPDGSLDFDAPHYERTPAQTYADFQRLAVLKLGHWKYGNRHDLLSVNLRLALQISFLELGPLYSWLQRQFARFFDIYAQPEERAHLLIYPSHPITDMLMDRVRQDAGFKNLQPEAGMIPVKFVGSHTVSPLFASHLVAHQIKLKVEKYGPNNWSAVILDDGVVSGKHLRELTQLLQAHSAREVFTCAVLDRSSLPANEEVMNAFRFRHRRFWRWDVPTLGHTRDCPLCQAIAIVRTFSNRLSNARQKARLGEWIELWATREVDTQWHKGGIPPTPFPTPMQIAFGIDEDINGMRHETTVAHHTSTSATASLLELTRLTTRADVALKKSRKIEKEYPDAAIEFIACQLLLFFDEFTDQEKEARFMRLLELLWKRADETPATSLAGLCMTLAQGNLLRAVWKRCEQELLLVKPLQGRDGILAVNLLRSRCEKDPVHILVERNDDVARHNYVMLDVSGTIRRSIREFLMKQRNPNNPNEISIHLNEMRFRLMRLARQAPANDGEKRMPSLSEVLGDMRALEKIATDLANEKVCNVDVEGLTDRVRELEMMEGVSAEDANTRWAKKTHTFLYGEARNLGNPGLIGNLERQLLFNFDSFDRLDSDLIGGLAREIVGRWEEIAREKSKRAGHDHFRKHWCERPAGTRQTPFIRGSEPDIPGSYWMYCDTFVREAIRDALTNVYYSTHPISDPFKNNASAQEGETGRLADMWWTFATADRSATLTFANASANLAVTLKQTVNIAGLGRVGGDIKVQVKTVPSDDQIVYTTLTIPLHSAFFTGS